jgi:serine/threonine protein kinase
MAPEQAELNNLDIDTRADIYSLGVMLYELLTGSPPFTAKQLRSAAFTEMLRMIREVEPPKPSTKLSSSAELPSIAAHRKLEPKRLTKLVAGELDWIVMKCLEKDRGRRYETANGLVMDIQRYLQDDPVLAGPPSAGYRLRKFARRYRAVLATAASFAVLLVLGVIGTTWQAVRAERARKLADEGRRQAEVATALAKQSEDDAKAQRKMAETAGKRAQQNLKTALDAVDRMLTRVGEKRLADIPEMEDERQRILEDALELFRRMLEQETSDPSVRRETAQAFLRTGRIYHMMGRHDEAQRAFGQALSIQGSLIAEFSDEPNYAHDLAVSHRERGELFRKIGRLDAAKIAYSDALRVLSPLTESHKGANEFNSSLAALHKSIGEWNCDTDRQRRTRKPFVSLTC